jgi:hypothetical protein
MPGDGRGRKRRERRAAVGRLEKATSVSKKVAGGPLTAAAKGARRLLLKVKTAGYVPEGVEVRARVSPTLVTVSASPAALRALEDDPEVLAISYPSAIRPA